MNSITRHLTPKSISAQIRMERQTHTGVFFLMEGGHDIRRFEKFLDRSQISVVACAGKENVLQTVDILQNAGHEDCLGFVDNDFDVLENRVAANDDVVRSTHHDFDMDVCATDVIPRYLGEVATAPKVAAEGGHAALLASLLEVLRPLSALRYANVKRRLSYKLSDLELHLFFDGHTLDVDQMVDEVSRGARATEGAKRTLRSHIDHYAATGFDPWQFTNGHDLIAALGIALQARIGDRTVPQAKRAEVERHLRLTFDYADFHASGLAKEIEEWGQGRGRLGLLRKVA